jgi:PAS domain S-box-containing protein
MVLVIILVFIGILITGSFYYSYQEQEVTSRMTGDLKSIAKLKADQVVSWREDRLSDAEEISTSTYLIEEIDRLPAGDKNTAERDRIMQRFGEINKSGQYSNVLFMDTRGTVRLSLDPSVQNVSMPTREAVARSLEEGHPILTDLHMRACRNIPVMDVVAPLVITRENGSREPLGAVILAIDPDEYLFPFIQSWPVPSDSAETLLVERVDDRVLFLNNLRHQNGTALNLTIPLTMTDVPAVNAVQGTTGVFFGKDYRGVDVISVLEPIPDSPWFMVAKMDTAEAYGPWRSQSGLIIALIFGTLAGATIVVGYIWQRRQKYYFQTLYKAEAARHESRQILEGVLNTISVRVFWKDRDLVYLGCNAAFARDAGFSSPGEVVGKDDYAMSWRELAGAYRDDDRAVIENGRIKHLYEETVTVSTGETINVLTSKVPLKDDNGAIIGVLGTYLDITAYRRTEDALRKSERHLRKSQEVAHLGSWELDVTRDQLTWSDETYRIFGLQPENFDEKYETFLGLVHPDDRSAVSTAYNGSIAEGKDSYEIEHRIVLPGTGKIRIVHEKCDHVRDASGQVIRSIGVVHDITERREADEELRQSEERFRILVDSSPVAMLVSIGVEEKVEFVNRRFTELFGYTISDVPDVAHWWPLAYPDERYRQEIITLWTERVTVAVKNRTGTGPVESEVTGRDGTKRFIEFRLVSLGNRNLVFATDLTERKTAMDEIRSSKAFLDKVIDMSPFSMWISDREGTVIRVNRSLCEAIGLTEEDIIGKYNVLDDDNLKNQGVMAGVRGVFEHNTMTRFSIPWMAGSANTPGFSRARDLYIDVSMFPILDTRGKLTNVVCQWVDITVRKRAEEALRESSEYLRNLFDSASAPIIVWDPAFRITRFNHAFESLTGRNEQEVLGETLSILFPEESRAATMEKIRQTLSGQRWEAVEIPILHTAGSTRIVLWNSANITSPEGSIISTIAQGQDITDRKKEELQRELLIQELEQKNAELERFTYTVSHDLKSPLITIKGFAGMLEEDTRKCDPVQLKKDVRRIIDAADTMQHLLNDVLELSRIGRIVSPPERVPLKTIVSEAVELLAGPLAERGVSVRIDPDLPEVDVDKARIREVMVNLIENAVKYMGNQPNPEIHIGVSRDKGTPVFFVRDNGIGIDPRYLERIFNLFEKLDPAAQGTGVGLTIVRRIIEVHGGKIRAESEGAGKGTTFRFTLPGTVGQGTP